MFNIFNKRGKIIVTTEENGDDLGVKTEIRNLKPSKAIRVLEQVIVRLLELDPTYLERRMKELMKRISDEVSDEELSNVLKKISEMK